MCLRYLYIAAFFWNYNQARLVQLLLSQHNYTLLIGKVGCLVNMVALLVDYLGGSVLKADIDETVDKKE